MGKCVAVLSRSVFIKEYGWVCSGLVQHLSITGFLSDTYLFDGALFDVGTLLGDDALFGVGYRGYSMVHLSVMLHC